MNTLLLEAREFSRLNNEQFQDIVQSTSSYEKTILNEIDEAPSIEAIWNLYEKRIRFFEIYYELMNNFRSTWNDLRNGINRIQSCRHDLELLTHIKNECFTYNNVIPCNLDEVKDKLLSLKEGRHLNTLIEKVSEATNENLNISSTTALANLTFHKILSKLFSYASRIVLGLIFFTFLVGGVLNLVQNAYLFAILSATVFFIQEFCISPKFNKYLFLRTKKYLKKGIKKFFNSLIIYEIYIQEEIDEVEKIKDGLKDLIQTSS